MSTRQPKVFMMTFAMLLLAGLTAYGQIDVTMPGNPIQGVPNDGDWPAPETPPMAIDNNDNTKFLHFKGSDQPTGIAVTPSASTIVGGITLTTANDAPERTPASFELYGSNSSITGPWILIASGNLNLSGDPFVKSDPIVFANSTAYAHYKLMFPTVKNPGGANSMQIAEIELLGAPPDGWPPQVDAGADQSIILPNNSVVLNGTVQDEGKPLPTNPTSPNPNDPNKLRWEWTVESVPPGSGGVQWAGNPTSGEAFTYEGSANPPDTVFTCNPTAIFDIPGLYVLRFSADDGDKDVNDTITVRVWPAGYELSILHYSFEGDPNDSSGKGHHGVFKPVVNGAEIVVDLIRGNVLELDGMDDFMDLEDPKTAAELGIGGNNPKSMAAWVYTRSFNNGGIFDVGAHSDGKEFCLRTLDTDNVWRIQYYGGAYDIDFVTDSKDKWVHFALVHDGAYTRMYVNGILTAKAPRVLNTSGPDTFRVGQYGGTSFDGLIDEFTLWDYALSPEEVRSLMPAGDLDTDGDVDVADLKILTDDFLADNTTPVLPLLTLDNMEDYQPGGPWPVPSLLFSWGVYLKDCLSSIGTPGVIVGEPNNVPQGDQALRLVYDYPASCDGNDDWLLVGSFLDAFTDLAQYDELRFWKRNNGEGHENITWEIEFGSNYPSGQIQDEHLVARIGPFSSTEDPNEWHEVVVDLRNGDNVNWQGPYGSIEDVQYIHAILVTTISNIGPGQSGKITVDVDDFRLLDYTPGCTGNPEADLNGDCKLDLFDYAIQAANFLKDPGL